MIANIEPMNAQSAGRLANLHARSFETNWSEREIAALLHLPTNFGLGLFEAEDLVGFAIIRIAIDEAELLTICIDPDARKSGLGGRLLKAVHETCLQNGVSRLFLEVSVANKAAQNLYARANYCEIGRRRRYYRDGSDALVLEKTLTGDGQEGA